MLTALPYHKLAADYFQTQRQVWQFFSDTSYKEQQLLQFKTTLLKNSYKFDPATNETLYRKVELAKGRLGVQLPVTLFQQENNGDLNASIVYAGGEAFVTFTGKILELLTEDELQAIIAHEISHIQLYSELNGAVETTDRIISAIDNNSGSSPAHFETARLFRLYTEIYCDRGAYQVTGDYRSIISALVKLSTGLQSVNADSYIKQADEIFALDSNAKAGGISHPENFIRARAIFLWHKKGAEAEPEIKKMIEGNIGLDELDLFSQRNVASITERVVRLIMQPSWIRTPLTTGLANHYFPAMQPGSAENSPELATTIANLHENLQDYLGYVLYDFATADKTLEDIPLGYAFSLAEQLKLDKSFTAAIKKEQKLTDKKISGLRKKSIGEYQKEIEQGSAK